jgi:hypothetical protein
MNLNQYLLNPANIREGWPMEMLREGHRMVNSITCKDGFTMSVQASNTHYCSPRNGIGPWVSVEVGFPSEKVEEFMEYINGLESPTQSVYGWVPVEVVEKVIEKHGGLA